MAEQEKNKNLEALHKQLVKDKYAVPADLTQFEYTFKDINNARLLFDQLSKDKYAIPADFDSFATTFGLKKKMLPTMGCLRNRFSRICSKVFRKSTR
jgi:hypothetical protein